MPAPSTYFCQHFPCHVEMRFNSISRASPPNHSLIILSRFSPLIPDPIIANQIPATIDAMTLSEVINLTITAPNHGQDHAIE